MTPSHADCYAGNFRPGFAPDWAYAIRSSDEALIHYVQPEALPHGYLKR